MRLLLAIAVLLAALVATWMVFAWTPNRAEVDELYAISPEAALESEPDVAPDVGEIATSYDGTREFLGAASDLDAEPAQIEEIEVDEEGLVVRGSVRSQDGIALSGVAVSIGTVRETFPVVRTNGRGMFEARPDPKWWKEVQKEARREQRWNERRNEAIEEWRRQGHSEQARAFLRRTSDTSSWIRRRYGSHISLRATMPGYLPYEDEVGTFDWEGGSFEHDFIMRPGTLERGRVLDDKGSPQAGVEILLLSEVDGEVISRTRSGEQGAYDLAVPSLGTYDVLARADGLGTGRVESIALPVADASGLPNIVLTGSAMLNGTVAYPNGKPVKGVVLRALPEDFAFERNFRVPERRRIEEELAGTGLFESDTVTGEAGHFELERLQVRRYGLVFPGHPRPEEQAVKLVGAPLDNVRLVYTSHRLRVTVVAVDAHEAFGRPTRNGAPRPEAKPFPINVRVTELVPKDDHGFSEKIVNGPPTVHSRQSGYFDIHPNRRYLVRASANGMEDTILSVQTGNVNYETTATLHLFPLGYSNLESHLDDDVAPKLSFSIEGEESFRLSVLSAEGAPLERLQGMAVPSEGLDVKLPLETITWSARPANPSQGFALPMQSDEPILVPVGSERRVRVAPKLGGRLAIRAVRPEGEKAVSFAARLIRDREEVELVFHDDGEHSGGASRFRASVDYMWSQPLEPGRYELYVKVSGRREVFAGKFDVRAGETVERTFRPNVSD